MTIFYLDPINGNDANAGTSFALRWKTLTSGATAARTAPGDTIRLIASPDPTSIGNAAWTDNSGTITPSTPTNKVVDECDSGWTAAANVTASHPTTGRKTGSAMLTLSVATAFTTGKAAYKTLGATADFSAFQQVSLWFTRSSGATNVDFQIKFCSDTTGDVPLATLSSSLVTADTGTSNFVVTMDNGAALPSGVNSIAIYFPNDPSTTAVIAFSFDNIVACKAPGDASEVTHATLIGKKTVGEPEWYPLLQITDTTYVIGADRDSTIVTNPPRPYRGTTETVTTYARQCLKVETPTRLGTVQEAGTVGNPITYSGGWNRTDMSTQTGETWLSGYHQGTGAWTSSSSRTYVNWENVGLAHYSAQPFGTAVNCSVDLRGMIGCTNQLAFSNATSNLPYTLKLHVDQIWGMLTPDAGIVGGILEFSCNRIHGHHAASVTAAAFRGTTNGFDSYLSRFKIGKIDNNAQAGIRPDQSLKLYGTVFENNATGDISLQVTDVNLELVGCTLNSATKLLTGTGASNYQIRETAIGGVGTAHMLTGRGYQAQTETSVTHTAGVSWKLSVTSANWDSNIPARFQLAQIACEANKLVTFKCWLRRTNTGLSLGLATRMAGIDGVADAQVLMTAAADTWEEVTITFTPTAAVVVPIYAVGFGGTTHSGYFDDITVTQAS